MPQQPSITTKRIRCRMSPLTQYSTTFARLKQAENSAVASSNRSTIRQVLISKKNKLEDHKMSLRSWRHHESVLCFTSTTALHAALAIQVRARPNHNIRIACISCRQAYQDTGRSPMPHGAAAVLFRGLAYGLCKASVIDVNRAVADCCS
jgi:hypothetical protein